MTRAASVRPRTGERTRQDGLARTTTALERFRSVPPPPRILDRAREQEFTERQLEVFDKLGTMFESGFAELNMADLAKRLNCSLRTLYTLAPSRDDLMLSVVDRHLWEVGRAARHAIRDGMSPLEAVEAYLHMVTLALADHSEAFSRDIQAVPAVSQLIERHNDYVFAVTRALLDLAVEQGEVRFADTAALARVMAGLGWALTRPAVKPLLSSSPKEAADAVVDVIIRGLRVSGDDR